MAIVKLTIDTDKLGEAPKLTVDGKRLKVIKHISFGYDTATSEEHSIAHLLLDTWPNDIKKRLKKNVNKGVSYKQIWHTAWESHKLNVGEAYMVSPLKKKKNN